MLQFIKRSRAAWLVLGVFVGAAVALAGSRYMDSSSNSFPWGELPLHAAATHGTDQLTIATVPIDDVSEAVVCLDHTTGELTAYVMNVNTWEFFAKFVQDSVNDHLEVSRTRTPKFSMVTGTARFRPKQGAQLGAAVIYIAEENSGNLVAYGIPWTQGRRSSNAPSTGQLVPLHKVRTSSAVRRSGEGGVVIGED